MAESEQRGKDFFEAIEDSTEIELQNRVSSLRGASESLLDRAENLGVPDQMRDAQSATTLSLRLRRDALGSIAANVTEAAADAETADAIESITNAMGAFYASDILWDQVARPRSSEVLEEEGVEAAWSSRRPATSCPRTPAPSSSTRPRSPSCSPGSRAPTTSGGLQRPRPGPDHPRRHHPRPRPRPHGPRRRQRGRGRGPEPGRFRGERRRRRRHRRRDRASRPRSRASAPARPTSPRSRSPPSPSRAPR